MVKKITTHKTRHYIFLVHTNDQNIYIYWHKITHFFRTYITNPYFKI